MILKKLRNNPALLARVGGLALPAGLAMVFLAASIPLNIIAMRRRCGCGEGN